MPKALAQSQFIDGGDPSTYTPNGMPKALAQSQFIDGGDPSTYTPNGMPKALAQVDDFPFPFPNPFTPHNTKFFAGWAEKVGMQIAKNCLKKYIGGGGSGGGGSDSDSGLAQVEAEFDLSPDMEKLLNSFMPAAVKSGTALCEHYVNGGGSLAQIEDDEERCINGVCIKDGKVVPGGQGLGQTGFLEPGPVLGLGQTEDDEIRCINGVCIKDGKVVPGGK